jgi:hypothetical protein
MTGGSPAPARGADQDLGRNAEFLMEIANHIQGKWTLALHHLINACALANDSDQEREKEPAGCRR